METNILNSLKKLFWFGVLVVAGCSSSNLTSAPPFTATLTEAAPTFSLIKTPTSLPFGGKIAFIGLDRVRDNNQIYVINADGSGSKNITPPNIPSINSLAWSPDGKYIAFDAFDGTTHQIFKMKSDGSDLQQLTFRERMSSNPSWSPDGKNIIFESSDIAIPDIGQIYIMNSDGSSIQRLIVEQDDENTIMGGSYRSDGFISVSVPVTRHSYDNYVINSDGVIQTQYPTFVTDIPPVWSPDGRFALLTTIRTDCSGLIIMKYDDSERVCLQIDTMITPPVYVGAASWSPDGRNIIFASNLDGDWDIYVINPDGVGLTQLTNMLGDETFPVWSP